MGANGATKVLKVIENVSTILAIELFNASQALHFREPAKTSPFLLEILGNFRSQVPVLKEDQVMADHIKNSKEFLSGFSIENELLFE